MPGSRVLQQIARKDADKEKIAERIMRSPGLLPEVLGGLDSERAAVRYGCLGVLRILSEKEPHLLYPRMDLFIGLLDHENRILRWGATFIIANLTRVDTKRKFEKIFDRYFAPISGPVLVTAANVIGGAATIALAKPKLADRIARQILKVEKARYRTAECRRVALGQAVASFDAFFDRIRRKGPVVALVRRQLRSPRRPTKKKAERFLERHGLD